MTFRRRSPIRAQERAAAERRADARRHVTEALHARLRESDAAFEAELRRAFGAGAPSDPASTPDQG